MQYVKDDAIVKETRLRLLHLHHTRIGRKLILHLLLKDPSLKYIYTPTEHLQQIYSISYKIASSMYNRLNKTHNHETFQHNIRTYETITIIDENYPYILKQIKDPPIVLYVRGNKHLLSHQPLLSVIGSRNPTKQGWEKVSRIVPALVEEDWTIVSGMARGIDGYAHEQTLQSSGKTIAILGGGFHHIYPKEHISLFENISTKGLVLSEYPPDTNPQRYHFPERNRIISGLSFGTLVIEAKKRSGTMITVDQALDQGREVYAVPGSPFEEQTTGCNYLIQEGAKLVQDHTDILEDWKQFGAHMFHKNEQV